MRREITFPCFFSLAACLILISISIPQNLSAKTIKGIMIDKESRKPIPNGMVMVVQAKTIKSIAVTDSSGLFFFEGLEMDRFNLRAKRIGYFEILVGPILFPKRDTLTIIIEMNMDAIVFNEIVVSEKRLIKYLDQIGFYSRQKSSSGQFLTPDDLKYRQFNQIEDLLKTLSGLSVRYGPDGLTIESLRYGNASLNLSRNATARIYLDGFLVDAELISLINPSDIGAVEYYKSALDTPMEYGGLSRPASTVLLWTKH